MISIKAQSKWDWGGGGGAFVDDDEKTMTAKRSKSFSTPHSFGRKIPLLRKKLFWYFLILLEKSFQGGEETKSGKID